MSLSGQGSGEGSQGADESRPIGALTFTEANQPRQPRNLQDLLRYSTEVTQAYGTTGANTSHAPIDQESRKFLEEAVKSMTVDVILELMKSIETLKKAADISEDADDSEECEAALDHIFLFVDNLDVANDFHKIGGFSILGPCLNSPRSSIRWRGAELVAELCQNNPYCQTKILESQILPILLNMIDTDVNDTVKVKALYAVSCLVRHSESALKEFSKSDGFSVLLRSLQSDIDKLNIKAAFLLSTLCSQRPEIKDDLVSMGYVEQLVGQIAVLMQMDNEKGAMTMEHLLSALLGLVQDHEPSQAICRNPELQFRQIMQCVKENSEGKDQFKEQYEYAHTLLNTVYKDGESNLVEDR